MSINGLGAFAPMGYTPHPPPKPPPKRAVHHTAAPISVADDSTFDRWLALPENDGRTIEEFAANPVWQETTWHSVEPDPPSPPKSRSGESYHTLPAIPNPVRSFGPSLDTGVLNASYLEGPPNRVIIEGTQPKPWPRK